MGERMRFKVITLCGSMKFKDDFKKMEKKLTFEEEAVVLIPDFFETIKVEMTKEFKNQLSEMHKQRIDLSDEIFVINKGAACCRFHFFRVQFSFFLFPAIHSLCLLQSGFLLLRLRSVGCSLLIYIRRDSRCFLLHQTARALAARASCIFSKLS